MDATSRNNWDCVTGFIFFPPILSAWSTVKWGPCFESVESARPSLANKRTVAWTSGKKKREIIKLRLNLLPFRTRATGFSFSLRPFRCEYLLNGRTGINYFPLCWRAPDALVEVKIYVASLFRCFSNALFFRFNKLLNRENLFFANKIYTFTWKCK